MSRSNVRVRTADHDDAPALIALIDSAKLSSAMFSGRPSKTERGERIAARVDALLSSERRAVVVAFDESEQMIGCVVVLTGEVSPIDPTPVVQIGPLVFGPGAQQDVIGRALLAAVVRYADEREIDHVLASATYGSRDANRYLARLGFAPVATRRIASTVALRRAVGAGEVPDRLAARRRLLAGRAARAGSVAATTRTQTREV